MVESISPPKALSEDQSEDHTKCRIEFDPERNRREIASLAVCSDHGRNRELRCKATNRQARFGIEAGKHDLANSITDVFSVSIERRIKTASNFTSLGASFR